LLSPLCKRGIEGDLFKKSPLNPSFSKRGTERLPWGEKELVFLSYKHRELLPGILLIL